MESKNRYDREVALRDLFWKILLDWKRLIVCAFVFALIAMGLHYIKAQDNYNLALAEYEKQVAAVEVGDTDAVSEDDFSAEELQQINDAKSLQSMLDRSRSYMQNSLLMNMNAYKENVLILEYYVDSDYKFNYTQDNSVDYTDAVVRAYGNYVTNSKLAQQIVEELSLEYETRYVEELIDVITEDSGSGFSVEIVYPDETVLPDIAAVVKEAMNAQTTDFSKNIGSHSLKLISENITVRTDDELATYQQNYQNMINNYRNQLNSLKNNMTDAQLEVLGTAAVEEDAAENEDDAASVSPVEPVKPGFRVKYLVLGFLVGIVLSAMWSICQVLFSSKLQNPGEIFEMYGVRLFGTVQLAGKKSGIDAFLLKLKNRNCKQMTAEEQLGMITSNIELMCKNEGLQQIYITGSEWEKLDEQLRNTIVAALKEVGIEALSGGNICYDMVSLRKANEVRNVVLLEQAGVSVYREMEQEIRVLGEQGVRVLGCVGVM